MNHEIRLIIGNKNYSSWSLRPWLLLKAYNIPFESIAIELLHPSNAAILQAHAPTGKVPVLLHGQTHVWDSLAIFIYANDYLIRENIWGETPAQAAYCQSIVAEMHSGFMAMRTEMPMNIRATAKIQPTTQCLRDIARLESVIADAAQYRQPGDYLLGVFSAADAYYAPMVLRLVTYANASSINLQPATQRYCEVMLNHPDIQEWQQQAIAETRVIDEDEAGEIFHTRKP